MDVGGHTAQIAEFVNVIGLGSWQTNNHRLLSDRSVSLNAVERGQYLDGAYICYFCLIKMVAPEVFLLSPEAPCLIELRCARKYHVVRFVQISLNHYASEGIFAKRCYALFKAQSTIIERN